jgi:hypothetical protein
MAAEVFTVWFKITIKCDAFIDSSYISYLEPEVLTLTPCKTLNGMYIGLSCHAFFFWPLIFLADFSRACALSEERKKKN